MASMAEMKEPSALPFAPPKATPMPTPSVREWSVMTATMRSTRRASRPAMEPKRRSSCFSRKPWVILTKTMPSAKPTSTLAQCGRIGSSEAGSGSAIPSLIIPKLAAIIIPPASALQMAIHEGRISRTNQKGMAPRPVEAAVSQP